MSNRLAELMSMDDRGARLARNVLTRAFRDMLSELAVDNEYLAVLTEVFLHDPSRQIDTTDQNKIANDRGNVKKEMEKDEFTIKVFLKLMRLLRLKEFAMTFHGTWHDGTQLGDGKGLHYIIDLDLEDVEEIELPENLRDSFMRTLREDGEIDLILNRSHTRVDDEDDTDNDEDEYLESA